MARDDAHPGPRSDHPGPSARTGVVAALPAELGPLGGAGGSRLGIRIHETCAGEGGRIVAALSGVGKVAAAAAAAALVEEGVDRLLVVGTCGGLRAGDPVGQLVHARRAVQWDLAVREGREHAPDPELLEAWMDVAGGVEGTCFTADRPAIRFRDRVRRARASGPGDGVPVADMETAAVAAVASQAGIPWAALRVISDARPGWGGALAAAGGGLLGGLLGGVLPGRPVGGAALRAFEEALRAHGGRPAGTVHELCRRLAARSD